MLVTLPYCASDIELLRTLASWIRQLGAVSSHSALLVPDAAVPWSDTMDVMQRFDGVFGEVRVTTNDQPVSGWPAGPNSLFRAAAQYVHESWPQPWLWLETDAVPLCPGWLDKIEAEYRAAGKPYLGALVACDVPGLPKVHLAGTAVYPADAILTLDPFCAPGSKAWDIAGAEVVVPKAANSVRIQHFWGQPDLPPTFIPDTGKVGRPVNAFTLAKLHPEAALWHRNKDGTLINLLWDRYFPHSAPPGGMVIAYIFCPRDAQLAVKNMAWMAELGRQNADVLLWTDAETSKPIVSAIEDMAKRAFRTVYRGIYPVPPSRSWPQGNNFAWTGVANYMHQVLRRPWFFYECDGIALKPDWYAVLDREYRTCGKPFMGPIVKGPGHCNGTAIYPWDTPKRCPKAMASWNTAFDAVMKEEMIADCHDGEPLMQHLWGIANGRPHGWIGNSPTFSKQEQVDRWVNPKAVYMHRNKDGTLIDRLRERRANRSNQIKR